MGSMHGMTSANDRLRGKYNEIMYILNKFGKNNRCFYEQNSENNPYVKMLATCIFNQWYSTVLKTVVYMLL